MAACALVWFAATMPCAATAQSSPTLPDEPSARALTIVEGGWTADDGTPRPVRASKHAKFIFPDQQAPVLTSSDKVTLGLIHGISLYSTMGWVLASEYEYLIHGIPHYGRNLGAYGQDLGAAALRGYSEEALGTSVLAPLLHEDPRFYRLGPRHGTIARGAYAVTRTLVTRNDAGHQTLNLQLLGGNLAGSALTNAYYPATDRGFGQTLKTFGGSMGGAAFGFLVDEFLADKLLTRTMLAVHLKHP